MYQHTNGRKFYAPDNEPEVPASIASVINGIVGLDNHAVWHPFNRHKEISSRNASMLQTLHHFLLAQEEVSLLVIS